MALPWKIPHVYSIRSILHFRVFALVIMVKNIRKHTGLDPNVVEEFHSAYAKDMFTFEITLYALFFLRLFYLCLIFNRVYPENFTIPPLLPQQSYRKVKHYWIVVLRRISHQVFFKYPKISRNSWYFNKALIVDSTHCPVIRRMVPPGCQRKFYSYKHCGPALSTQITIEIIHHKIVHVYGPVPASASDKTIYRKSRLREKLGGKFCLADGGYSGCERLLHPYTKSQTATHLHKQFNKAIAHARWSVEATFSRMKNFAIIKGPFRHSLGDFQLFFFSVACLYNIDVSFHPLVV